MAEEKSPKPHFILSNTSKPEPFRAPGGGGGGGQVPPRERQPHGQRLLQEFEDLKPEFEEVRSSQEEAGLEEGFGLQIEFESFPDIDLAFESLAKERSGIELLNVRHGEKRTLATVFMPDGKLQVLENLVRSYLDETKDGKNGKPKNQKLLDAIRQIRVASLKALWTDDPAVFPQSEEETLWWEVWLPVRNDRAPVVNQFKQIAEGLGFGIAPGQIEFPERTVLLVQGSMAQMQRSVLTLNSIAELRRAKETADFFDSLSPEEQTEWSEELKQRLSIPDEHESAVPHVCVLDTGINNAHPLLEPALSNADLHTVDPNWGTNDNEGHGTEMGGLVLMGDLTSVLASNESVAVHHRLESVKLLDRNHSNSGNPDYHGYLTIQAVSRPEIAVPQRQRVFSMAVTARDGRDRGRPSAWSATIDRLAVDYENQGETPRLFVLSAGNVDDPNAWANYPDSNSTDSIHDPGQAWNALTVGAGTELIHITEPNASGYQPIAPAGGLSPFSTTSQTWQSHWPLKPHVVFEGGNAAKDAIGAVWMPSLSLLTTNADIRQRLFTNTRATSAATALAARMAARLMAEYPELRAETIRGLMVHSAQWTPAMQKQFLINPSNPNKGEVANLVRRCGFGQPDLTRALWSAENSLTLICEDSLHPFERDGSKAPKLRDMNLHQLPGRWNSWKLWGKPRWKCVLRSPTSSSLIPRREALNRVIAMNHMACVLKSSDPMNRTRSSVPGSIWRQEMRKNAAAPVVAMIRTGCWAR